LQQPHCSLHLCTGYFFQHIGGDVHAAADDFVFADDNGQTFFASDFIGGRHDLDGDRPQELLAFLLYVLVKLPDNILLDSQGLTKPSSGSISRWLTSTTDWPLSDEQTALISRLLTAGVKSGYLPG